MKEGKRDLSIQKEMASITSLIGYRDAFEHVTTPTNPKEVPLFKHKGEEVFLVLEGKVKFTHGGREIILEEGDCIYFDSGIEHSGAAMGPNECKCMMVSYSPS